MLAHAASAIVNYVKGQEQLKNVKILGYLA